MRKTFCSSQWSPLGGALLPPLSPSVGSSAQHWPPPGSSWRFPRILESCLSPAGRNSSPHALCPAPLWGERCALPARRFHTHTQTQAGWVFQCTEVSTVMNSSRFLLGLHHITTNIWWPVQILLLLLLSFAHLSPHPHIPRAASLHAFLSSTLSLWGPSSSDEYLASVPGSSTCPAASYMTKFWTLPGCLILHSGVFWGSFFTLCSSML